MFFPYKEYRIRTKESLSNVIRIFKNNTSVKRMTHIFISNDTYFEGDVSNEGFKISRVIHYRNSFLPIIIGRYERNDSDLYIKIKMRLHSIVIGFGIFWFLGVILGIIAFLPTIVSSKSINKETISSMIPIFMFIFGYLLFTVPFLIESRIAEKKIIELVNGEIVI